MHYKSICLLGLVGVVGVVRGAEVTTISMAFSDETAAAGVAKGRVYDDRNGNGKYDAGLDLPIARVGVSDGDNIALSGNDGKYALALGVTSKIVFITQPANYQRMREFYFPVQDDGSTVTTAAQETSGPRVYQHDFALRAAKTPDSQNFRFVQTSDIHIGSADDRERFASALAEINDLAPAASFVVATGDLINSGDRLDQYNIYTSTALTCRLPYFHVFGNHDANRGADKSRNYRQFLGPDYYSADYGNWHLVMLNCVHPSERQDRWLERDMRMLGAGKKVLAFQHYPPKEPDLGKFQNYGVRAVFTGHWHSNKITEHENGLVSVNQPTLLMGGIDGSPSSFRIVSINGEQINTELRINNFEKRLWISYPQGELTGPERLVTTIYDTTGGVREARFRIQEPGQPPLAQGDLKQVSPLCWMAPLDAERLGIQEQLPSQFTLRVRATNNRGEQWETTQTVAGPQRGTAAAEIQPGGDWPEFMGNAQRTGRSSTQLRPPLQVRWTIPTHGYIDIGSPVVFKDRLAIGVKDRDNLINNGILLMQPRTGKVVKFVPTDSMINHSPAFAEDTEDGPGKLYAASVGGTVYTINPEDGAVDSKGAGPKAQQRWVYSSPAVQQHLVVLGSSANLQALNAQSGESRWTSNFGVDWISSYASPTLAGDLVIMGANWLDKQGKPASIYALDVNNGQLKWTNGCEGTHGAVAVARGNGYAVDDHSVLKVIDLATGADVTTRSVGKGWSLSTPAVDEEVVIAAGASGEVHAFDIGSMQERWVFRSGKGLWKMVPYDKTNAAVFSSPTIAGAYVYIGCSDGRLYALDKRTGDMRWFYNFGVPTLSTPCVSGNALYTAAYDGNVYAFTSRAAVE